jgi:hypothetical protein
MLFSFKSRSAEKSHRFCRPASGTSSLGFHQSIVQALAAFTARDTLRMRDTLTCAQSLVVDTFGASKLERSVALLVCVCVCVCVCVREWVGALFRAVIGPFSAAKLMLSLL